MSLFKTTAGAITIAAAFTFGSAAFAQQGTTLAGPAQGSKANGASSDKPSSSAAGANAGSSTSSGGSNAGQQPTATSEQHEKLGN